MVMPAMIAFWFSHLGMLQAYAGVKVAAKYLELVNRVELVI